MTKDSEMKNIMGMFEQACGVDKVKTMSLDELKTINEIFEKGGEKHDRKVR